MSEEAAPERIAVTWRRKRATICERSTARRDADSVFCIDRYLTNRAGGVKKRQPPLTGFRNRREAYR